MTACVLGANEWCTASSPCFSCEDAAHTAAHPDLVDGCLTCQLRSVQLSPSCTPSKPRRLQQPGSHQRNSWERGIATDSRGMPLLDGGIAPISVKKYGENRRKYESARHQLANA